MKRILRLFVGVVLGLAVFVGGIWFLTRALSDREAFYHGKPGVYWFQRLTNQQVEIAESAKLTLNSLIIPHLTNQMFFDTNDSDFKLALVERLNGLPGIRVGFVPADGRRAQAVNDIFNLGSQANSAAPALLEILRRNDEVLCGAAAQALVKVGADPEAAIPILIARLRDKDGNGRPEVVEALGQYGPKSKAGVPMLVKLLEDRSSKEIRWTVPEALKKIDPEAASQAGVK